MLFQHMIMSDPTVDLPLRCALANNIAQFYNPKYGNIPQRPEPAYFKETISLPNPHPATIAQVRENIDYLFDLKAKCQIDRDWCDNFIADQQTKRSS
jgi:hypothetical protein